MVKKELGRPDPCPSLATRGFSILDFRLVQSQSSITASAFCHISLSCVPSVSIISTFQIHNNDLLIGAVYLFYQIERPFPGEKWNLNNSIQSRHHSSAALCYLVSNGTLFQHSCARYGYIRCKLSTKSAEPDPVLATFQT